MLDFVEPLWPCRDLGCRGADAPTISFAGAGMPSAFSGVLNGDRTDLLNRALRAQHGDNMAELERLEDAISIAESALDAGAEELRAEAGFKSRAEFEQAAEEVKAREYQPWLKKYVENGKEIVRVVRWDSPAKMSGGWPIATLEDIARGQFFENREAYDRANAGLAA